MISFARPPVLVLMGVSGCGKSTVGAELASRLGWDLGEADDLHPAENIAKMASGHPLTDADRAPWLVRVRAWIDERVQARRPGIITCSALKRAYRDVLRDEHVVFVHLTGTRNQLLARLSARHGHFMPATLLDSQLAMLDPPGPAERALTIDIGPPPSELATRIEAALALP